MHEIRNLPATILSSMLAVVLMAVHPAGVHAASAPEGGTEQGSAASSDSKQGDDEPAADAQSEAAASKMTERRKPRGPETVEAALEAGDLTTARTLATNQREQNSEDPSAWRAEAEVHEARGDLAAAIAAWNGYLRVLPEDAKNRRAAAKQRLDALRARARGTVADEPESTHREDFARETTPAVEPKPPADKPAPAPSAEPEDRLVEKWYFWVTLAAIAASAAAVTGIAIKAATTEQSDALGLGRAGPPARGPALFRF